LIGCEGRPSLGGLITSLTKTFDRVVKMFSES
jgi:hypothetical protein